MNNVNQGRFSNDSLVGHNGIAKPDPNHREPFKQYVEPLQLPQTREDVLGMHPEASIPHDLPENYADWNDFHLDLVEQEVRAMSLAGAPNLSYQEGDGISVGINSVAV